MLQNNFLLPAGKKKQLISKRLTREKAKKSNP